MTNFETNCWLIWFWRHHGFWEHGWQWEGHLLKPLLCCEEAACPIISKESIKISFRLTLPSPRLKSIVVWKKNNRTHWIRVMLSLAATFCPKFIFQKFPLANPQVAASLKSNLVQFSCLISPAGQSHAGACCEIYFHKKRVWIIHQQMDSCPAQPNLISSLPRNVLTDLSSFLFFFPWPARWSIVYRNQSKQRKSIKILN